MAVSCRNLSLSHLLMSYAFSAVICIAYGDRDGGDKDGHDGARSTVKTGSCCVAKTTPLVKPRTLRVLQHPLTPATPVR